MDVLDSSPISPPLLLTIRFTTSIPDLSLTIPSPATTTPLSLKQQIRSHLPAHSSSRRLRLIHSGKILSDTSPLHSALRLAFLPPPPRSTPAKYKSKGEGKATAISLPPEGARGNDHELYSRSTKPIYIHCSIGDDLNPGELEKEAVAAENTSASLASHALSTSRTAAIGAADATTAQIPTTTPAPRGFDRLAVAGVTPQEISSLRAQFLQLQAHTHAPDEMPTAAELRELEEQWIMNDSDGPGGMLNNGDGVMGDGGGAVGGFAGPGGYEDLLIGNLVGFFWPIGAVVWLLREESIWSGRRSMAVFTGMLVNMAFSVLKMTFEEPSSRDHGYASGM
ncbi:MAG: hypothetical protein M1837_005909 [Sclerophora amabilis]|nr:MAG: hypothetical protein M1837_005909 [Sclerophora amabilis]